MEIQTVQQRLEATIGSLVVANATQAFRIEELLKQIETKESDEK